ncbi:MAG: YlxR family protein [Deinococcus sp.]|nr:YlxR family protein [Deinococcus sp.]
MASGERQHPARHVPERRCVLCRASRPRPELVRLVVRQGQFHLDQSGRAPGRGAYVCADQHCWQERRVLKALGAQLWTELQMSRAR